MTATVNYSSSYLNEELNRAFEAALTSARHGAVQPLPHLVNGVANATGTVFERCDPAIPDNVVSAAHTASNDVIDAAVAAARSAAREWRIRDYQDRIALLRSAKAEFTDRCIELAGIISAETGKTRLESIAEAQEAVDLIEHYCVQLEKNQGFVTPMDSQSDEINTDLLLPYGVFAVLAPFNFPVALAVNMTTAALVTGNTVVLKPSDKTPRSTSTAADILARNLPEGVLNLVHGGIPAGEALVESAVDGIAFTGSAEVGWNLVRKQTKRSWTRPVLAEMGGQNPAIVTAFADLDAAAEGIVRSAFGLSGQKCSACRRVVVDRSVHDQLVSKLVERTAALVIGDSADARTHLGPVIDDAITSRIDDALVTAARDGNVRTGGRLTGYFFAPVIVTDLPLGHPLTRNELFGPFLTVTAVDGLDQAIEEANAVDYGLSAGIFTQEADERQRFLNEIEAGIVYVNRREGATTGAWPGIQSFCGWKASGSVGKGGLGPWYLPGFCREQSRTVCA
ncbi:aldehyde dehydrogenase family protein [Saccharopolyspora hattusasensis]|uniref:aldehyde dehydrogenase family protein n=1 Tax=Saccharopolyspora hattusasensis TaxID=1128679 RepID=UPI003D98FCB8